MGVDNNNNNAAATRVRSTAQDVLAFGRRQADRAVRPETRRKAYEDVGTFARERPILFVCSFSSS